MAPHKDDPTFFLLADSELNARVAHAQRRVPRHGAADIAGRVRVRKILEELEISSDDSPERIAGATNEVWRCGDYIIRVGFDPGAKRLHREALLSRVLPHEMMYPKLVGSGVEEALGEWMVVKHRPGVTLSAAWGSMSALERDSVLGDLAVGLRALHQLDLDDDLVEAFQLSEEEKADLPHQLPAERLSKLLETIRGLPYIDSGFVNAVQQRLDVVGDSISEDEHHGMVHGDLHFENALAKDGVLVAILDCEWSRPGPPEIDLDMLARFCAHPQLHVGGNYHVDPRDYKDVLRMLSAHYPDLFAHPRLQDRLMLCALAFEVPLLVESWPPPPADQMSKFHPINRIRDLLDFGTHAERLGF